MKVHYLEIVSLDVDAICKAYEATHNVTFGEADALLGGARTCTLPLALLAAGRPRKGAS